MPSIIATLTIGQAPRSDLAPLFDAVLPKGVRCIHAGVLDGLTLEEIARRFAPEAGEPLLTSKLLDGSAVVMGKSAVRRGLEAAIERLEDAGAVLIVLLCTGDFEGLPSRRAKLIEPDHVVPPVVAALAGGGTLGVLVPLEEQARTEGRKWRASGLPVVYAAASPYTATPEEVRTAARKLKAAGAEMIALDCMGYRLSHKMLCQEATGLSVVASSDLVVRLTGALL